MSADPDGVQCISANTTSGAPVGGCCAVLLSAVYLGVQLVAADCFATRIALQTMVWNRSWV